MKTIFLLLNLSLINSLIVGQAVHKISVFAKMVGNYTLYDRAMDKAPGFGTGVEMVIYVPSGFRPLLDLNCDVFPTNAVHTFIDGVELEKKKTIPTVFVGISYPVFRNFYIAFEAGPAFINSGVYPGIKPGVRYFLDKYQRINVALSLTHIFEADHSDDGDFGYANLGLNFRVF